MAPQRFLDAKPIGAAVPDEHGVVWSAVSWRFLFRWVVVPFALLLLGGGIAYLMFLGSAS